MIRWYRWNRDTDEVEPGTLDDFDADRRVDLTVLDDGCEVSTVFISLDHGFGQGAPLVFETMVFSDKCNPHCERYATAAEARAGHARIVAALKEER